MPTSLIYELRGSMFFQQTFIKDEIIEIGSDSGTLTHVLMRGSTEVHDYTWMNEFLVHHIGMEYAMLVNVTHFDCSRLALGDVNFSFLVSKIAKVLPSLLSFSATHNKLTDVSMVAWKENWPVKLQLLDLGSNMITDVGLILLMQFLQSQDENELVTLALRHNRIKDAFDHPYAVILFERALLQRIDLRNNSLNARSVTRFLERILNKSSLHTFLMNVPLANDVFLEMPLFFFEQNRILMHVTMPSSATLDVYHLTNHFVHPNLRSFLSFFNKGVVVAYRHHFERVLYDIGRRFFSPREFEMYGHTGHPFFTMMMTVLLCNSAFCVKIPVHVLIDIFSFLHPASYPTGPLHIPIAANGFIGL